MMSYNLEGMASHHRRLTARAFFEELKIKLAIICLQEHKL